jgi:hypothetical protein
MSFRLCRLDSMKAVYFQGEASICSCDTLPDLAHAYLVVATLAQMVDK